jgi:2-iminobutanoate/2-iminopropanoate deaminase
MNGAYRPRFGPTPPARLTVQAGLTAPNLAVEIALTAVKGATRVAVTTPDADGRPGPASPNLSSAIRVGNRLYVSGLVGSTPGTRGSVEAQSAEILARTSRTLAAAGFSMADVVDGTVFMRDMGRFAEMNGAYAKAFPRDFPARATVGLPPVGGETLVEMMFVAAK